MLSRICYIMLLLLLGVSKTALGGPPDLADDKKVIRMKLEELKDSLKKVELGLLYKDKLLFDKLDSIDELDFIFLNDSGLAAFDEIIINEDGTVKVLTDSGMVVLSYKDLDIISRSMFPDNDYPGRREITSWGKSVVIDEDERVIADITLIGGDVTINGCVEGDVVVIGGDIFINSTGYVRGDAIAVGGKVRKEEGAKVTGSTISIRFPILMLARGSVFQVIEGIMLLVMIVSIILSALSFSLFPKPIDRIANKLSTRPDKSFLFGYIAYIGFFLAWLLLLVSVIGIPLAFFGEPVAILILMIFAYSAFNQVVGAKFFMVNKTGKSFWYGILATTSLPFILLVLGFITDSLVLFIFNMILLGFMLFVLMPIGIGAATLARFGFPPRVKKNNNSSTQSVPATDPSG